MTTHVHSPIEPRSGSSDEFARAWQDWWLSLYARPELAQALAQDAVARTTESWRFALGASMGQTLPHGSSDPQFQDESWNHWPFNVYAHNHSSFSQWSAQTLAPAAGISSGSALRLNFLQRQLLDASSPAHYLLTNPELLQQSRAESGANLLRGAQYWLEDLTRTIEGSPAPGTLKYRVGEQVAITPGKVVMRNELIELIQYSPQSPDVHAEPILITPAWIMKYYVLDLSPHNSLVRYLVGQGHTVFMISWRNPTAADRDLALDDYLRLGLRAALDAVSAIVGAPRVHMAGYCIGGTLLSIGAAALAREGDRRIASVTLFASQTDFSEPGELAVFISPAQLELLQLLMQRDGVLASERMSAAFALLRAGDLLWAPAINQYLRGERGSMNDLMAWNADGTRMPCRMHSEYLTRLYLNNELATGQFTVGGTPVELQQITVPMFVVGTETDHVAPWRSAYKTRALTRSSDFSFVLTSGGHNAGIISGPVNPKRRHRVLRWQDQTTTPSPEQYLAEAEVCAGSWWPAWQQWLARHSSPDRIAPSPLGNAAAGYPPLSDAPGGYVRG
ncbi:MAG TPA: alpha/beta fold hydrolase [Steroidobacteraceae bacterium]|nr:alpha/beta fold hydrolase [Steroidobacteraceae bacterium]